MRETWLSLIQNNVALQRHVANDDVLFLDVVELTLLQR